MSAPRMAAIRIPHWKTDPPTSDALATIIKTFSEKDTEVEEIHKANFATETSEKVTKEISQLYNRNIIHITNCLKSYPIFMVCNGFFHQEILKNAYDADATQSDIYIHDSKNDRLITAIVDNGIGVNKEFFKKTEREELKDVEGALQYLRLLDAKFDSSKPKTDSNPFNPTKLKSDKPILTSEDKITEKGRQKTGGRAIALAAAAELAHATGGHFFIMDIEDFRKSKHYQDYTGVTDLSLIPEQGTILIFEGPKFSQELVKKLKQNKQIQKKGCAINHFYLYIQPKDKDKLYQWKLSSEPAKEPIIVEEDEVDETEKEELTKKEDISEKSKSSTPEIKITKPFLEIDINSQGTTPSSTPNTTPSPSPISFLRVSNHSIFSSSPYQKPKSILTQSQTTSPEIPSKSIPHRSISLPTSPNPPVRELNSEMASPKTPRTL